MSVRYLGAHTPDAGGMVMAVRRAAASGMRALQVFTAPPTYYGDKVTAKPPRVQAFREALAAAGIGPAQVLVHGAYVMNTASAEPAKADRARIALAKELERSTAYGVGACCFHPGSAGDGDPGEACDHVGDAIRHALETVPEYFKLASFRVLDERRWNARGQLITLSEATIKVSVKGNNVIDVAEGNGPVNALDNAIRKALAPFYPELADMQLTDYKVRIMTPKEGTGAVTRVTIESHDSAGERWSTVGLSTNVIDASFNALYDAITYKLLRAGARPS